MGLFGLFKKKSESSQDSVPSIDDLPPIPHPDDVSSSDLDLPKEPLETPAETTIVGDNLQSSNSGSDVLNPDHLESVSTPTDKVLSTEPVILSDYSSLPNNPVSTTETDVSPSPSSNPNQNLGVVESSIPSTQQNNSSLPTFENVGQDASISTTDLSSDIDVSSLSISEIFVKKETYVSTLKEISSTNEELKELTADLTLSLDEKILTVLNKASNLHSSLNNDLLFIEGVIAK